MAEKTVYERSLELHEKGPGKVEVISKVYHLHTLQV